MRASIRIAVFAGLAAMGPAGSFGQVSGESSPFLNTASGTADALPDRYVPPLISNGSLCMLVDYEGSQSQRERAKMVPGIWWEGRRYGPPNDKLISFGHFEQELSIAGKSCGPPLRWTQTLDTKAGMVECGGSYGDGLSVESTVFVPLDADVVVVRKRVVTTKPLAGPVRLAFKYLLVQPGDPQRIPRRMTSQSAWDDAAQSMDVRYKADGLQVYDGVISAFCDAPVSSTHEGQAITLASEVTPQPDRPSELTFYLLFSDSMDGEDYLERASKLRERIRREGYAKLLNQHCAGWGAYWKESSVSVPDGGLSRTYNTAQYHLRANATKWSFPVGIFNTHWSGRFFGWDEMFCYQALVSSNHRDVARRCPEFRLQGLEKAVRRASHYGRPGNYGARYPWETLEDGTEGSPPGYWMEHVFHMSHIALAAWFHHLYTDDLTYLKDIGYPVIRECARFFAAYMIYETSDGGMFVGKCTDLERLGPAKLNPFMTSCGVIYTLECAAKAAAALGVDAPERSAWQDAAAKLRRSLPHDGGRYIPYAGCTELSIASLGGLFPYPVFDETEERQRNAVYHFVRNGRASGNMYPVGDSVCAWYAGWMAAALAALGDKAEPAKLLVEAAGGAGCFGELFEINEAKVSMRPWFSTASGNFVYALNQMLLQSRDDEIRIAAGAPEDWQNYDFKLACHGNLVAEVSVKGGRLARLDLVPGDPGAEFRRRIVVPERLLRDTALSDERVLSTATRGGDKLIEVTFKGRAEFIKRQ